MANSVVIRACSRVKARRSAATLLVRDALARSNRDAVVGIASPCLLRAGIPCAPKIRDWRLPAAGQPAGRKRLACCSRCATEGKPERQYQCLGSTGDPAENNHIG